MPITGGICFNELLSVVDVNNKYVLCFNELLSVVDVWMFDVSISYWLISDNCCLPILMRSYCLANVNYHRLISNYSCLKSHYVWVMYTHQWAYMNHQITRSPPSINVQLCILACGLRFCEYWLPITISCELLRKNNTSSTLGHGLIITNHQIPLVNYQVSIDDVNYCEI